MNNKENIKLITHLRALLRNLGWKKTLHFAYRNIVHGVSFDLHLDQTIPSIPMDLESEVGIPHFILHMERMERLFTNQAASRDAFKQTGRYQG